jgi:RNA polymerase sigma factor (sigma-70 family)
VRRVSQSPEPPCLPLGGERSWLRVTNRVVEDMGTCVSRVAPHAEAFDQLFREHYRDVLGYALRRADPETARDVAAETFVVAWRRFDQVPVSPRPWLFGIARRVLANARRTIRRNHALLQRLTVEAAAAPEDESQIERSHVLEALERMSASDREILQLVAWEGLNTEELAVALGSSGVACRVRLHRARRRFAAALNRDVGWESLHRRQTLEER